MGSRGLSFFYSFFGDAKDIAQLGYITRQQLATVPATRSVPDVNLLASSLLISVPWRLDDRVAPARNYRVAVALAVTFKGSPFHAVVPAGIKPG